MPQFDTQQQNLSNWLDDFEASKAQVESPSYPNAPQGIEDQINDLPNAEKLTGVERWLYQKLPGFTESGVGKALMSFSESPAGQVLGALDVLAEGAERTLGLMAQYRDLQPGDDLRLKDAWAAGSLFWDTANLPQIGMKDGLPYIRMDTDLPGSYALTEARKLIGEGKSLDEVKSMYYDNLGALAMRAQLNDALGHIAADPLNWALGAIKPIERIHAIRHLALTGKMDVEVMQGLETAARIAGNVEEADKIAEAITTANKTGKALNRVDKFAIMMTGGIPYLQKGEKGYELLDVSKLTKGQQLAAKLNPFALTPQARASELLDIVAANVGEHLIRPNWNADPEQFLKAVAGAARGAVGNEWGHLATTIQGRTVQALLSNADAVTKALGKEWTSFANERSFLQRLSALMPGSDERTLWRLAKNDPGTLWTKVQEVAQADPILFKALQEGTLTPKNIEAIGTIDNSIPLLKEEFYAKALVSIEDVAMRQSILQFGIKEKGMLTKWSDALKAWETLPFIKANPANMVRNIVNNDVTLIGRGLFGTMLPRHIDDFWKGKYMPKVFTRGFGLGGDAVHEALTGADKFDAGSAVAALEEALTGNFTLADKVKEAAAKVDLKKFDFSQISAEFERTASKRASTMGWMQFHQQYWNKKTGFTSVSKYLDGGTLDEMEQAIPGITKVLDEVAEASGADSAKFAELMQSSIEHNVATIFKNTEDGLGFKMTDVLGADTIQRIREGLPQALKENNVQGFVDSLRMEMEQHVDDMFSKHVENLPGIVAAQVQAGGPMQFHRVFSKAIDGFWGGNVEHSMRMSTINDLMAYAKQTGDYKKVNSLWNKVMTDSEAHFGRVWKKFEAYQEGMMQGAKNAGVPFPKEVSSSFKEMKSGWEKFFEFRNNAYRELFEGKGTKDFDGIQKTLDTMYEGLAAKEDELYQRIDDMMVESFPDPLVKNVYRNWRDQVGQLRLSDRQHTIKFYKKLRDTASEDAPSLWSQYWSEKVSRIEQIRQLEQRGSAAIQGDSNFIGMFLRETPEGAGSEADVFGLAERAGIASMTKKGVRNERRILSTVNKYLPEGTEPFKSTKDIPLDVAQKAFEARNAEKTAKVTEAAQKAFIPDAEKMFPDPMPIETAISELNYGRGYATLDALVDEAVAQGSKKSALLKDLPEHLQKKVGQWATNVDDEMNSFRAAGVQYAAFRRDSALLNYNRRTNFDNMVGHMAPFAFWTTHSVFNWAIYSLDRPAMLTSYFRARKFFETAGLPDQNVPTRLRGHIRVNLPFAPEWMGDTFFNPMRFALPFDAWMAPWEQATSGKFRDESKAKATLDQMLEAGEITADEHKTATDSQSGDIWDRAMAKVKEGGESYDAMDFVSMTMTPHAPLMWAYNAVNDQPNEIGPFTPMTKTVRNLATMMGVEDWSNSPYNIEARVRKHMGLPAYDKWEDYRIQREISNMAADGKVDLKKVREAMEVAALVESGKLDIEEAKNQSDLFRKAIQRANIESGGWWGGAVAGILGIPLKSYPTGEQKQRELGDLFGQAMDAYGKGDPEPITKFFEDHPEYESRLALFKSPEERIKNFMIDNMWSRWNDMPKVNQDEARDQLGENFVNFFLTKETRNYESIKPEQLQIWLALVHGKQIGKLAASTEALVELNQLKLTDPETAWRVQTFYDTRKSNFADFHKWQDKYYSYPQGSAARSKYLKETPQLKMYWDFRRKWMEKNPDLARFLTDDEKQLAKYANMKRDTQSPISAPTRNELMQQVSPEFQELIQGWTFGQDLPPHMERYLEMLANQYSPEINARTLAGILTGR